MWKINERKEKLKEEKKKYTCALQLRHAQGNAWQSQPMFNGWVLSEGPGTESYFQLLGIL